MSETNHFIPCPHCGAQIDCRDLNQVFGHANWSEEKKAYVCEPGETIEFSSSKCVGEAVEWIKGKHPVSLN